MIGPSGPVRMPSMSSLHSVHARLSKLLRSALSSGNLSFFLRKRQHFTLLVSSRGCSTLTVDRFGQVEDRIKRLPKTRGKLADKSRHRFSYRAVKTSL